MLLDFWKKGRKDYRKRNMRKIIYHFKRNIELRHTQTIFYPVWKHELFFFSLSPNFMFKNWFLAPIIREHLHHPTRSAGPAPSGSQYTLHWRTDHEMNNGADNSTLVTAHKYWEQLLPGITINTELCLNKLTQNEGPGKIKKNI